MEKITIKGTDYKLKYTIRAMFIYEQITGKPFGISTLLDNYIFFYSMILANNPDNILETGIDIIAVPPGKNKKSLSLLSGGERTMTAISLLFAIMNLEKVPFVILDEVESALDENNATVFGEYLANYKNKTQLLVITHKKKTMEFLDRLYGVTMQESGVSKLVSVKLDN